MEQGRSTLRLGSGPQKLIPKDISQALGKLPPQNLEMEEAVLGALMLEKSALEKVTFLKPQHFYDDRHRAIMQAITELQFANAPVDMRTVVNQLKTTGKLELVGGMYSIAELTSKVSSAANVEFHARIVVELSIKRSLIETASQIHNDAYEEGDVIEMLDKTLHDLQFLKDRETKSSGPEKIKSLWEKYRIMEKPVRPETLVKIGDADVMTVSNISMIIGKKKSRKSLLLAYLIMIFMRPREIMADDLLIFDTEQEEYDVWQAKDRIYRMTNQHVPIFCLRGLNLKERREFIEMTVKNWHRPVKIIFIDGIRDLISNINDPDESTEIVGWMMKMNVDHKVHISTVLHMNKGDENARGHIGSELLNKAEITIKVELDERQDKFNPPSVVSVESSRRKPFEPFVFTHSPTGLPELLGAPLGKEVVNQDEEFNRLEAAFEGQVLKGKECRTQLMAHFGVGDNKARQLLAKFTSRGWVLKSGNTNSPNTTYKLIAIKGDIIARPASTPITTPMPQSELFATPISEPPPNFVPPPSDEPPPGLPF
jgi:hypothetical protein